MIVICGVINIIYHQEGQNDGTGYVLMKWNKHAIYCVVSGANYYDVSVMSCHASLFRDGFVCFWEAEMLEIVCLTEICSTHHIT